MYTFYKHSHLFLAYNTVWKNQKFTLFSIFSWADLKSLKTEDLDSDDEFFRETTDMLSSSKKLESLKKGKKIHQIKLTKKNHQIF